MALIEVNWRPERSQLRTFGWICLAAFGGLGAWVFIRQSLFGFTLAQGTADTLAMTFWIVAGASGVLAAVFPAALLPLHILLTAVSLPIGLVLSHVILAVIFFGLFTPLALVFKLIGRDALSLRLDREAASYWRPRTKVTDVKRYFGQY